MGRAVSVESHLANTVPILFNFYFDENDSASRASVGWSNASQFE